ncbi:MAG: hypothetical protein I3J02_02370 [Prevotella sp.]|nr:hypothetical protein [Prevotella sp.]
MKIRLVIFILLLLFSSAAHAQTPIANRIKSLIKALPIGSKVVAKYTDTHRHCLYYISEHRLYCYDVLTGQRKNVNFSTSNYTHILSTWLSPDGNFFFVAVDKGSLSPSYIESGQELWRFDSRTKRSYKVGQGYFIEHRKKCIIIKQASRCFNPTAPRDKKRWMGQNHYYDLYGKVIYAKEEFEIK